MIGDGSIMRTSSQTLLRLHGPHHRFELGLVSDRPDADGWCRVRVTLDGPEGRWSAVDPCLEGTEVERLADWLEAAEDPSWIGEIRFLEPELSFALVPGEQRLLRVRLRYNLRPAWAGEDAEPFCQDYPAGPEQLRRAAAALRAAFHDGRKPHLP